MTQSYNSSILVKILYAKRNMAKYNSPFTQKHFCKIAYTLHMVIFTSCPQQRPVQSCKTVFRCWCLFCMLIKCPLKSSSVTWQYCYLWIRWMQRVCNSRGKKIGCCWCLLWNTETRWLDQNAKFPKHGWSKQAQTHTHKTGSEWCDLSLSWFIVVSNILACSGYITLQSTYWTETGSESDTAGSRERCGLAEQTAHAVKRVTVRHSKASKSSTAFKRCSSFNITPVLKM